ncbi:MAG: [FeFe] hydrogenase H-cluster radical SAM maturase HydE [Candidatus Omnitrophota bacterium]|nr:[FeFe] hydrogenase H-cluster radical SAM maturase HydE [Candidatus Omnitrophota bacterium]
MSSATNIGGLHKLSAHSMCYSIPGKILEIKDNIVTVDYFGERKKAKNEFLDLSIGDYIYAQAGFVIQRITANEASASLETWKELFFKLREIDLRLAKAPKNLYQIANNIRQKHLGNSCCVHGIIEFSNYCRNDCLYCGLRKSNSSLSRYRMSPDEIIAAVELSAKELGFKALVLQSGEDLYYDDDMLVGIIKGILKKNAVFLSLSIGEKDIVTYKKLYEAGARGLLLRFETSNPSLYSKMRPGFFLENRLELIKQLRKMGFLIMTGFLIGLPQQSEQDILKDIEQTHSLGADMFSFGPFIPHPQTPLENSVSPSLGLVLNTIAQARILNPEAKILVTTSLETLDKENGARLGLLSGGNSLMINLTPEKYRKLYEIYPNRAGIDLDLKKRINQVVELLHSLGRAPTDLGI